MGTITSTHYSSKDRRVYIGINTTTIDKLMEKWYDDNEIYSLQFKSRAWSKITRFRNKVLIKLIRDTLQPILGLDDTYRIVFSIYAGCTRCPCSPGFLLKRNTRYRSNISDVVIHGTTCNNIWMDIDTSSYDEQMEQIIQQANNLHKTELAYQS